MIISAAIECGLRSDTKGQQWSDRTRPCLSPQLHSDDSVHQPEHGALTDHQNHGLTTV